MYGVASRRRARRSIASTSRPARPPRTVCSSPPRKVWAGGRVRSRGSSRAAGAPSRSSRHQARRRSRLGAPEPAPLPDDEVDVADRQRGKVGRRVGALEPLAVERGELAHQHSDRPAVGGDVVHGEGGQVEVGLQPDQGGPEEQVAGQVEGHRGDPARQVDGLPVAPAVGQRPEVDDRQRDGAAPAVRVDRAGRPDPLGHPVQRFVEHRAQGGVAPDHVVQSGRQGRGQQGARDPHGARHVVGGRGRIEPGQEPEPLLGEGGGPGAVLALLSPPERRHAGGRLQRGPGGGRPVRAVRRPRRPRPPRPGRRPSASRTAAGAAARRRRPCAPGRPAGWRGASGRRARRSRPRPRPARSPSTSAKRPAMRSSVGVRGATYSRRLSVSQRGSGRRRRSTLPELDQRQLVHDLEGRRHHVGGELVADEGAQLVRLRGEVRVEHQVGGEPAVLAALLVAVDDRRLEHPRVLHERGLDLAQLDAEAADLDLLVDPAQELHHPVAVASGPGRRSGRAGRPAWRRRDRGRRPRRCAGGGSGNRGRRTLRRCTARPGPPRGPVGARRRAGRSSRRRSAGRSGWSGRRARARTARR